MDTKILEKLKCFECKNYLSYLPVMINNNGDSICGKCSKIFKQKYTIKNKAYEEIAKTITFPCAYEKHGCGEKLLIGQLPSHENNCEYYPRNCPVPSSNCAWTGPNDKILGHCIEKHSDLCVRHPYEEKVDITVNKNQSLVTTIFGFTFLVQISYSIALDKIQHCVYFLGRYPKLTKLFEYTFELYSHEANIKKTFEVQTKQSNNPLNEVKISGLVSILGGLDDITFKFCILMKDYQCDNCKKKLLSPLYCKNKKIYCKNCKPSYDSNQDLATNKLVCKDDKVKSTNCKPVKEQTQDLPTNKLICSNDDCNVECLSNDILLKHERWFCYFSKLKCKWGCGKKLNSINRFEHYISDYTTSNNFYEKQNNLIDIEYMNVLLAYNIKFLCKWYVRDNSFSIYIVTDLPADKLGNFVCRVVLSDAFTGSSVEKYVSHVVWKDKTCNYDYSLSFQPFKNFNIEMYHFSLIVDETEKKPTLSNVDAVASSS